MKNIILYLLIVILLCGCSNGKSHHLKDGYAVTLSGDTLHFYGGTVTGYCLGSRDIHGIVLESDSIYTK